MVEISADFGSSTGSMFHVEVAESLFHYNK